VRLGHTLLDKNVRDCSTTRANRGHSTWPRTGRQMLENRAVTFLEEWWHNGPSVEGQKTCVNDKYDPWFNNSEHRKERQKNKHGHKEALHCRPVRRTDRYLSCYSVLMKTVKKKKKKKKKKNVVLYLLNCTLFNAFFVYRTLNTNKTKVQELPAQGRKVLDIRRPEHNQVKFWWPSSAREAINTKGA